MSLKGKKVVTQERLGYYHGKLKSLFSVDQTYNATSTKAQSGKAVAQAIASASGNDFTIDEHDKSIEFTDVLSQETVKMFKSTQAGSEVLMYQNINSGGTASIALPTMSGVSTEVSGMFQSYDTSVMQPLAGRVSANETAIAGCYTKQETEAKIAEELAKFEHLDYEIVDTLPATGDAGVRYLVKHPTDAQYDEYIYVNDTWNDIGSTDSVDLSSYYNKTETDALLDAQKVTVDSAMSDTSENAIQNKAAKTYVDTQVGDMTALNTSAKTDLVSAINELKFGVDAAGEPFRVKQWANSFNVEIPCCTEDITNGSIAKMVFKIEGQEATDYQIVGMIAYEVFDAATGGNRLNCWPVCQFTGQGQTELSVRWTCMGTTRKTARRINAWVLLKHR